MRRSLRSTLIDPSVEVQDSAGRKMKYFRRCSECRSCVCHTGFWRFVCWLDCHHGHGSFIGSRVPLINWPWWKLVANPICALHDKHIWEVVDG